MPTTTETAFKDMNPKSWPSSSAMPQAPRRYKYRIVCRFQFGMICYRRDMYGNLQPLGDGRRKRARLTRLHKYWVLSSFEDKGLSAFNEKYSKQLTDVLLVYLVAAVSLFYVRCMCCKQVCILGWKMKIITILIFSPCAENGLLGRHCFVLTCNLPTVCIILMCKVLHCNSVSVWRYLTGAIFWVMLWKLCNGWCAI